MPSFYKAKKSPKWDASKVTITFRGVDLDPTYGINKAYAALEAVLKGQTDVSGIKRRMYLDIAIMLYHEAIAKAAPHALKASAEDTSCKLKVSLSLLNGV